MKDFAMFGVALDPAIQIDSLQVELVGDDRVALGMQLRYTDSAPVHIEMQRRMDAPDGVGTASLDLVPKSYSLIDRDLERWLDAPKGTMTAVKSLCHRALVTTAVLDQNTLTAGVEGLQRSIDERLSTTSGAGL